MRTFEHKNITLVEEDDDVFTLHVSDQVMPKNESLSHQELALLPEELDCIIAVIEKYKISTGHMRKVV